MFFFRAVFYKQEALEHLNYPRVHEKIVCVLYIWKIQIACTSCIHAIPESKVRNVNHLPLHQLRYAELVLDRTIVKTTIF